MPADGGPFVLVDDLDSPILDDVDVHHLARARRLRDGAPVVLGDGAGAWRRGRFSGGGVEPAGEVARVSRPSPEVAVGFALVKGSKPELVVQKLVELGVDHVRPFTAARSVVRWDAAKADAVLARWRRVAIEAAAQCRRPWVAEVHPAAAYVDVAALAGACRAERDGAPPTLDRPLLLVGPEGGWDDHERAVELPTVGLGPNVLRAETASIAAGAILVGLRAGLVAQGRT